MTREEAITVLKAFMDNPLFSDMHKAVFSIAIHDIKQRHEWDINKLMLVPKTECEQEPTTKNDLGVDCISRADARSLICKIDLKHQTFGMSRKAFKDLYNGMDDLPSVTPIRPKGHWIWCGGSHKCSNCGEYTCFSHKVRYCPNCGSDNREVEDGND